MKKYVYGLGTQQKSFPFKGAVVHMQGVTPQAAAEMTPDQTPVFGRKFRLLC